MTGRRTVPTVMGLGGEVVAPLGRAAAYVMVALRLVAPPSMVRHTDLMRISR